MDNDQDLWAAVVTAEQQLAFARAEFSQHAKGRSVMLAAALQGSNWEQGAALSFLEVLSDDVPELLDSLVEHATSHRWALAARRAIASGRRETVTPILREVTNRRLAIADADDYRRLAELLRHVNDREALDALVQKARNCEDPDILEVAEDFSPQ